jgi:hypothetical protein
MALVLNSTMDSIRNAVAVRIESTVLSGQRQRIAKLDEAGPNSNMTPQARQKINHWIRSTKEFDGMVDFDAILRNPAHPTQLLASFDSGDHLHSNDAGNTAVAGAIPLAPFSAT